MTRKKRIKRNLRKFHRIPVNSIKSWLVDIEYLTVDQLYGKFKDQLSEHQNKSFMDIMKPLDLEYNRLIMKRQAYIQKAEEDEQKSENNNN